MCRNREDIRRNRGDRSQERREENGTFARERERVRERRRRKQGGERERGPREAKQQTGDVHCEVGKSDRCSFFPATGGTWDASLSFYVASFYQLAGDLDYSGPLRLDQSQASDFVMLSSPQWMVIHTRSQPFI